MGQREILEPATLAVDMRGISKHFGGVQALLDVDLQIEAGEIHALLAATAPESPPFSRF